MTRRGIFGLLGGALLAKVVGPQLIAAPTPALWQAAKVLPRRPIVNTYLPLEYVCAETLRIVNQDLKWLRLRQVYDEASDFYPRRIGDTYLTHRARYEAAYLFLREDLIEPVIERVRHFNYDNQIEVSLDLSTLDPECPFGHLSKIYIEPTAHILAEKIICDIRRRGGADTLVTGRLPVPPGVERCVVAKNEDSGLALRAVEVIHPSREWAPYLHIDMILGLG